MPARQPFDERHLQDVVLAQSGQIRATRRFSALEVVTRPLVAIAAIVAIVAIALGIRDYVDQQKANVLTSPDASTISNPKAVTRAKKTASAKTGRARMSAADAPAAESAQAGADGVEKPIIGEESADAGAKPMTVMGYSPNPPSGQAAREEPEAAIAGDNRTPKERNVSVKSATCLPLPNGTQPGDVDGPYYLGWATEYCGHDLNSPSSTRKLPDAPQPKR